MSAEVRVRDYTDGDADACEALTRDAFWNVYRPGCHEHLVWHRLLAGHADLLPGSTLVAEADGRPVGCIASTRAFVEAPDGTRTPVVAVGPLAVLPTFQRRGIGSLLMRASLGRSREQGEPAAFLYGNPAYYPRFGFVDSATFDVTTADGENFEDFMALELAPGGLAGVEGRLVESTAFEVEDAELDAFDARFRGARRPPGVPEPGQQLTLSTGFGCEVGRRYRGGPWTP